VQASIESGALRHAVQIIGEGAVLDSHLPLADRVSGQVDIPLVHF